MLQFFAMRSSQGGFLWLPILIVLGLIIVEAGTYFVKRQNTSSQAPGILNPNNQTATSSTAGNSQSSASMNLSLGQPSASIDQSSLEQTAGNLTSVSGFAKQMTNVYLGFGDPTRTGSMGFSSIPVVNGKWTFSLSKILAPVLYPSGASAPTSLQQQILSGPYPMLLPMQIYDPTSNKELANGVVTIKQSSTSVPGMSKYTDADFGFSFWYPKKGSYKIQICMRAAPLRKLF